MIKAFISTLLITPAFFAVALLFLPWVEDVPAGLEMVRHYASYPLLILTMLLSLSFNQTRLFFVLYLTAIFLLLILGDVKLPEFFSPIDQYVFIQLVFLFYLLTVLFFLFSKECDIFSLRGFVRLIFCTALPVIPLLLAGEHTFFNPDWLSVTIFPQEISQKLPLPDFVVAFYLLTMCLLLISLLLKPAAVESSFFGLLAGAGLSLYFFPEMAKVEFIFSFALVLVLIFILQNSFHLAYRDELTGLAGRRALREQMDKLSADYSIAMLDIDFFKKFNDRYGHDVGDQVLKMVAQHIGKAGGGSKAYRYGGEEFTLVFTGRNVAEVKPVLETLREAIADTAFKVRSKTRKRAKSQGKRKSDTTQKSVKITISIGIAGNQGTDNTPEDVIKIADKALYRAKKKGRNRVST
ncbi:MAG: GGDEF domain-containing protein [Gammaproteobacteria bacterium]|nr:GGDEF domain-containing protein [Gammaproteobacteria bacterium]